MTAFPVEIIDMKDLYRVFLLTTVTSMSPSSKVNIQFQWISVYVETQPAGSERGGVDEKKKE